MSTYLKKRFPLLVIGATIILFWANAFYHIKQAGAVPALNIINCDYYNQLLPWFTFAKQSIVSGSFPLWTPYQALGHPFYAEAPLIVFYPPNWLLLLFDVPLGLFFIQLVTVAIAMVGMTLYLRYLEVDWPGAVLGSVLFAYPVYLLLFP